jgi:Fe-S-cluster containining protein
MQAIVRKFDATYVYRDESGDWRTTVRDGRCVFQDPHSGACTIHGEDFYPVQCRAYPWHTVVASATDPDTFVDSGIAYAHAYECPVVVLAVIDQHMQELAATADGTQRKRVIDEFTTKILPPGHAY